MTSQRRHLENLVSMWEKSPVSPPPPSSHRKQRIFQLKEVILLGFLQRQGTKCAIVVIKVVQDGEGINKLVSHFRKKPVTWP